VLITNLQRPSPVKKSMIKSFTALLLALPYTASTQSSPTLDVSGVALYWRAVDGMRAGKWGADSAVALLASHPGYQLIQRNGGRLRALGYCFHKMTRRTAADSALMPPAQRAELYARVCAHLRSADSARTALDVASQALTGSAGDALVRAAYDSVRRYLPPEYLDVAAPPVYVLLFEDNGFGGASIALDLLRLQRSEANDLPRFLAHELHHSYLERRPNDLTDDTTHGAPPAAIRWLGRTQWEGIASLIDKSFIMRSDSPAPREPAADWPAFALGHAALLRDAPAALRRIDSAVAAYTRGSLSAAALDSLFDASIPDGGHALGQFMASAIDRDLGRVELLDATRSRFRFITLYNQAARTHLREYPVLSEMAMQYFARLGREFGA
jgi:hypothetical protein